MGERSPITPLVTPGTPVSLAEVWGNPLDDNQPVSLRTYRQAINRVRRRKQLHPIEDAVHSDSRGVFHAAENRDLYRVLTKVLSTAAISRRALRELWIDLDTGLQPPLASTLLPPTDGLVRYLSDPELGVVYHSVKGFHHPTLNHMLSRSVFPGVYVAWLQADLQSSELRYSSHLIGSNRLPPGKKPAKS